MQMNFCWLFVWSIVKFPENNNKWRKRCCFCLYISIKSVNFNSKSNHNNWDCIGVLIICFLLRKQTLQNDSSAFDLISFITCIVISLSAQFTNRSSSSSFISTKLFDNIPSFNAAIYFFKLIQQLASSILERQNAVLCHQMIPLSTTIAGGLKKRSHISH